MLHWEEKEKKETRIRGVSYGGFFFTVLSKPVLVIYGPSIDSVII